MSQRDRITAAMLRVPPSNYQTSLDPGQEKFFRQWVAHNKIPFNPDVVAQDYDMRGFWQGLQQQNPRAQSAIDPNDMRMHYPDYWKTPLHETFSAESQWAQPDSPSWSGDRLVSPRGRVLFDDAPKTIYDVISGRP